MSCVVSPMPLCVTILMRVGRVGVVVLSMRVSSGSQLLLDS